MSLNVHLLNLPEEEAFAQLRCRLGPDIRLTTGETLPGSGDVHYLVAGRPQRHHLADSPRLRGLIVPWAGLPEETRELARSFPHLTVHNLHHNAVPTAELALALLLSAAKCIVPLDQALRRHDWRPRYQPSPSLLLSGKTALILGYGAIGQHVAKLCRAFGMEVMATKRQLSSAKQSGGVSLYPAVDLADLLPRAHALIICLPLTPETRHLVGGPELALLPAAAVLVNIGRGDVVDQAALYQALLQGDLGAAGLDVWYNYPKEPEDRLHTPPGDYPFHQLDNVVMSPHRGGSSDETERLRMSHLADLLNSAADGEPVPNQIDLTAGY